VLLVAGAFGRIDQIDSMVTITIKR
jgi:hypothetical protein